MRRAREGERRSAGGDALATAEPIDEGATGVTYALDPRHAVEFNKALIRRLEKARDDLSALQREAAGA